MAVKAGYAEGMGRSGPVVVRRQLLLWVGVLAVAAGLLAMHQLSLNHTIVDPGASRASALTAPAHLDHRESGDSRVGVDRHLVGSGETPWSGDGGCPGCGEHHAVALTCLAALIVVVVGWALSGPIEWRGFRLRPFLPWRLPAPPRWSPLPLSLVELSISRT